MVKKVSRRLRDAQAKVENKAYEPLEALTLLKELATAKFDETAEAHIRKRKIRKKKKEERERDKKKRERIFENI